MNRNYFWLTERQFARLEPLLPTDNRDLLSVLSDLRSLCILVWCFAKYDITDKPEAAEYQLGYLKERFSRRTSGPTSEAGTFETCRRAQKTSAYRGRPEVIDARSERRD
jgi:hypothetical protein